MLKFTGHDKEQLTEIRQGWPFLLVFVCLLASYSFVDHRFGRLWGVVAAVSALLIWFAIRPWRFGLLSAHTRRTMRLVGVIAFIGFAVVSFIRYFRA
ncbi:MAG: hypothetical protein DME22_15530 [Verrucomicrobia bacterium]|nr:MAG: hypothetical protein DME22_15530 [Verrucomicrobiota bacterium]PYJ95628.1 MAG: hypothetical protein DME23_23480 [Verrucomicrobiota bacterium]